VESGGAARNVAEALARLGVPVALAGALGDDADGVWLRTGAERLGIDCEHVRQLPGFGTASYIATVEADGNLLIGAADMAVVEAMPPAAITAALTAHPDAFVYVDANLSDDVLAVLAQSGRRLAAATVSPVKGRRLLPHLVALDWLFCNRREAESLTGCQAAGLAELAGRLAALGPRQVAVTGGGEGAAVFAAGHGAWVPALPAKVLDPTGAGDTFAAVTLAAWLGGVPAVDAAALGARAAVRSLASRQAIADDLTPADLQPLPLAWPAQPD
jgi:pseudouridine kinase